MPTRVKSLSRHKIPVGSLEPVDWLSPNRTGGSAAREYSEMYTKMGAIGTMHDFCVRNAGMLNTVYSIYGTKTELNRKILFG